MKREIEEKFSEYIKNKEKLVNLAQKLSSNYTTLMVISDEELRRNSNNFSTDYFYFGLMPTIKDEVYSKLDKLMINCSEDKNLFVRIQYLMNKIINRTMKEDEYNYLLNNSPEQILKDKKKEFYPKKSLIKELFN